MFKSKILFLLGGTKLRKRKNEVYLSTSKVKSNCLTRNVIRFSRAYQLFEKKIILALLISVFILFPNQKPLLSQTQVLFDNFESGTTNWTLTGNWGLDNRSYNSYKNSLSDSPSRKYKNLQNTTATLKNLDLSSFNGAELNFWVKYELENAFDFVYLEISIDGGNTFNIIDEYTGNSTSWQKNNYNIGSFAGNSNIVIRFRFSSDQYVTADGIYIDDLEIIGLNIDDAPPLVIHQGPENYEGTQDEFVVNAEITDISGVNSATLYYWVDSIGANTVNGINTGGNQYSFSIPSQEAGALVTYKITAIDKADSPNETNISEAQSYDYISGTYKAYDNGNVDNISIFNANYGAAVKISVPTNLYGSLVTILIRNYADPNLTNDNMLIHIWDDNNGLPGNDLITPVLATPEANLDNPFPFTIIDLRDYFNDLMNLTSDFYVGFTVPQNSVNLVESNNNNSRSYYFDGTNWSLYSKDYEIRAILYESYLPVPVELTTFTASALGNYVKLDWETATEVNNYGFEIQRKSSLEDYKVIDFVHGNGNSNSPKLYSYEDKSANNSGKYTYRLKQIDIDGTYEYSDEVEVILGTPAKIELAQNYPNPFNPVTSIQFNLPNDSQVRLSVFNILGEEISLLLNEKISAGYHTVNFNGSNLNSGIYFYQLQSDNFTQIRKMILVK